MPVYNEMDPELVWKIVEGHDNVLDAEARTLDTFYRQFRCPRCQGELQKEFDRRHAFTGDTLVARALLRCPNCRYLIDPHANIVLEGGNPAKIPVEVIPILGGKEG